MKRKQQLQRQRLRRHPLPNLPLLQRLLKRRPRQREKHALKKAQSRLTEKIRRFALLMASPRRAGKTTLLKALVPWDDPLANALWKKASLAAMAEPGYFEKMYLLQASQGIAFAKADEVAMTELPAIAVFPFKINLEL